MEQIRTIISTEEFDTFYHSLTPKVQNKFDDTLKVVKTCRVLTTKYIKRLVGTVFYEMRVCVGNNEYRTVLFTMDHDNIVQATRILLLNGFQKKSTKDYAREIGKAERILKTITL